jgi:tellurite resistance protein TerC
MSGWREESQQVSLESAALRGVRLIAHWKVDNWNSPEVWDVGEHFRKDGHPQKYKLFDPADIVAWLVFTGVFIVLILFDNLVLHRRATKLSFGCAVLYTIFWLGMACCFCAFIWWYRGPDDAVNWALGYILEWMLSVDNLFVFHLIFKIYGTPDELKHRPLFWGIVGAIFFRMLFFIIEELLLHSLWWMHIVLGIFLIYTGIKTATSDDDDEDPRQNKIFILCSKWLPLVNGYDSSGAFFVRVPVDAATGEAILPEPQGGSQPLSATGHEAPTYSSSAWYRTPPTSERVVASPYGSAANSGLPARRAPSEITYKWRATLLFLVVMCLEVTDILFAVDSVSAIVAQIPDLFLAYTACVFAMLGLRALFFVIDELISLFVLLKYGVMLILVFIGLKLILKEWMFFPNWLVASVLIGILILSILCSVVYSRFFPQEKDDDGEEAEDPLLVTK